MPKNSNAKLWRFPDHEKWVPVRVNSGSKASFITDLKLFLQKFDLEKKFKEGPFGMYLDLKEPLTVYGQLIHNILKREIIHPKGQREDEMWFGLGNSKARFGQEEFCLCTGLNMGQLPKGFANNNQVEEDSILRRIFKGKRPTAEVLYATLRRMTQEQSEDAYKMLNIYMVSQFFGTDDGRTTAIPGWLFTLVEKEEDFKTFPWGSYIFSLTIYFMKDVLDKRLPQLRGEKEKGDKKEKKGKLDTVEEKEDEKEGKKQKKRKLKIVEEKKEKKVKAVEEKKEKSSKYYTYNLKGFPLALQVWAMERIIRLENVVGKRLGTGYPRFTRWEFDARIQDIESSFNTTMTLFIWDAEDIEKKTNYFKSLDLKLVCEPLPERKREKLTLTVQASQVEEDAGYEVEVEGYTDSGGIDASVKKQEAVGSVRKSRTFSGEYSPPSKKRLFSDENRKVPSTIPELYAAMLASEERIISFCKTEFQKIRNDLKLGEQDDEKDVKEAAKDSVEEDAVEQDSEVVRADKGAIEKEDGGDKADNDEVVEDDKGAIEKEDGDKAAVGEDAEEDARDKAAVGEDARDNAAFEEDAGDKAAVGEDARDKAAFEEDAVDKAADGEAADGEDARDKAAVEEDAGDKAADGEDARDKAAVEDDVEEVSKKQDVEEFVPVGPTAIKGDGMVEDSGENSILNLEEYPSPTVCFIAQNFPSSVVALTEADPNVEYRDYDKQRARKRSKYLDTPYTDPAPKKKKSKGNEEDVDVVEFTSFLKSDDQVSYYTGQIIPMTRHHFLDLVNVEKWISDLHIHSYFDILWRRRSSSEVNYKQNIGLVNTSFFMSISKLWAEEMKVLDSLRVIDNYQKEEQAKETNCPPSPEVKKERRKKGKKASDPSKKAANVWEGYPEFSPLNYQPTPDILRHVTGHELLYPQPWWLFDSVLIPCHVPGHWMLCHVLLKEGKVMLYDSMNERKSGLSPRMKDICGLLYLLPSVLKHAGYYQELKMDPHASPFTAESLHSTVIPQQDDGSSCGAFLMKYADLIMAGVPTPWKSIFGQKNIKHIRKAIALEIYTNGQLRNSP